MSSVILPSISIPLVLDLSALQRGVAGVRAVLDQVSNATRASTAATNEATRAAGQHNTAQERLSETNARHTASVRNVTAATGQYQDAQGRLRDAQGRYVSATREATVATGQYRDAQGRLRDANGRYAASATSAAGATDNLKNAIKNAASESRSFADVCNSLGRAMSVALTAPLVMLGKESFGAAVRLDSLKRALVAVTGSTQEAEAQMKRLREVAKLPGLGFEEAVKGSLRLQNSGLSARFAERSLMAFGNAVARAGGGKAELDGVTLALSQIALKGKISQQELNQLAERGIVIGPLLKKAFGTANTEELGRLGITSKQFFEAIIPAMEKLPKVGGGIGNTMENLSDTIKKALLPLGDAIIPNVIKAIETIVPIIERVSDAFSKLPSGTQQSILVFGGLVAAAGPVIMVFGAIAGAITAIGAPIVAGVAAITLLGVAFATNAGGIRDVAQRVLAPVVDFIRDQWNKLVAWFRDNLPLIKETFRTVVTFIREFWEQHGERILAVTRAVWDTVKEVVSGALDLILGILKTVMQFINGDWEGAWATFLDTAGHAMESLGKILLGAVTAIYRMKVALLAAMIEVSGRMLSAGRNIGISIVDGILAAIQEKIPALRGAIQSLRDKLTGGYSGAKTNAGKGGTEYNAKANEEGSGFGKKDGYADAGAFGDFGAPKAKPKKDSGDSGLSGGGSDKADAEAAAKRESQIADAMQAAKASDANTAIKAIKDAFDKLRDSVSGLDRVRDPRSFDDAIIELRRLSGLIADKDRAAAGLGVGAANAKLAKAKDPDAKADAQADLIKAQADQRAGVAGANSDATNRTETIGKLKRDKYRAEAKARQDDAKEASRFAAESLRDNLVALAEKRKMGEISTADYLKQLKFLQASQKKGSDEEMAVIKAADAEKIKLRESYNKTVAALNAALEKRDPDADQKQAVIDLEAGRKPDGERDTAAQIATTQAVVARRERLESEADARYRQRVREQATHLRNVFGGAIDHVFNGQWQNALQSFVASFKRAVQEAVTAWLASAIAKLFTRREGGIGLAGDAEKASGHMIKGAAAIALSSKMLDEAAKKLESGASKQFGSQLLSLAMGANGGAGGQQVPGGGAGGANPLSLLGGGKGIGGIKIGGALGKAIPWVAGAIAVDQLLFGGKGMKWVGKQFGNIGKGIKKIFGFSKGGVLPDVAMVHKNEMLVQPRPGSMALPAALTKALMSGGGRGANVNVNIQTGNVRGQSDIDALAQAVAWHTRKALPTARAEAF